ncbi:MAG: PAS domain S-box protein, partial [Humidesulfovibrio sp.]|nr:PAS domain S-box protein [Humidesulfovibrio sp.]
EEVFGVRREDFIGKRVLDLEYLPAEDRETYQFEDEAVIACVGQVQRERPFLYADGALHQTLYSVTGFRLADGTSGGLIGVIVDITELKQTEEALRQSEEKFARIFEMAPECISFVRLRDAMRIDANAAFETVTGYPREEAIGRSSKELCIWDDLGKRAEFLTRLKADGHVRDFEFLLRRKDGTVRRVLSSAQLVLIAGDECYVSVIHDITDERKLQELLIQSEKMMSVGSLAAGIAHEINNPLGIVHQAVQNLILRTKPDQKKNLEAAAGLGLSMDLLQQYIHTRKLDVFLEDIQAAAMRASGIIRNMLNFSRRSESKRQTCNLHCIIEQAVFLASSDYDLK